MTEIVHIYDAKTQLSRLVERAAAGEDIVIARAGLPLVRLIPFVTEPAGPRTPGLLAHVKLPEAFFDPLPPEETDAWE